MLYEPFTDRAKRVKDRQASKTVVLIAVCLVVFALAFRVIPYFLEPTLTNILRRPLW